jgi:hypothetical protein
MTMKETTEKFINHAWWLEDYQFDPLKAMLVLLAEEIDANFMTSTAAEWNRAYRHALSLKPEAQVSIDPLEEILKRDFA